MNTSEFKFLGYQVQKIDFELKDGINNEKMNINIDIKPSNKILEDNKLEATLEVNITDSKQLLSFYIKMKGLFLPSPEMDETLFKSLADHNAYAILFPFLRAVVSTYTLQANIPPIILPTFNFFNNKKVKNEIKKTEKPL